MLNRLYTMAENSHTTAYGYDLNGNIVQKVLPNGDTESVTFDALNRDTAQSAAAGVANGGGALYAYGYTYDLAGNVMGVAETYPGGLNNRSVANTYDAIYRLLSEADTVGVTTTTTGYTYDAANNRLTKSLNGGTATTYAYNSVNQLTSTTAGDMYTYDADGSRTGHTSGGNTDLYGYDFENRLVSLVKTISGTGITTGTYSYAYDYRTRRVLRDESAAGGAATQSVFSGGTSVQEYTLSGTSASLAVEYVRGSDYGGGVGGVLYTLRSGSRSYTHENRRGDVVAKTGETGSLTYQAAYEAFGKRTQEQGSTLDRQKANTKDEDPTGLLNEGHRYRDLETGCFITADPAGFVDGPNLYTYVKQNPWTSFDPEGLAVGAAPATGGETASAEEVAQALKMLGKGGGGSALLGRLGVLGMALSLSGDTPSAETQRERKEEFNLSHFDNGNPIPAGTRYSHGYVFTENDDWSDVAAFHRLNQTDPDAARRKQTEIQNKRPENSGNPSGQSQRELSDLNAQKTTVYMGDDGYIGITNDFARRQKEWKRQGRDITPLYETDDRETARGVEQIKIEEGRAKGNEVNKAQDNSIDPNRTDERAQRMRQKGKEFMDKQKPPEKKTDSQ